MIISDEARALLRMIPAHRKRFSVNERVDCGASADAAAAVACLERIGAVELVSYDPRPNARYVQCRTFRFTESGASMHREVLK
jgi:hypothetical protein